MAIATIAYWPSSCSVGVRRLPVYILLPYVADLETDFDLGRGSSDTLTFSPPNDISDMTSIR